LPDATKGNQKEPIYRASSLEQEAGQPDDFARAERAQQGDQGPTAVHRRYARLKVSRRFRDVLAIIATDLGGVDRLSVGDRRAAASARLPPYLDAQRVLLIADVMTTGVSKASLP
jgi:hypothetical protein